MAFAFSNGATIGQQGLGGIHKMSQKSRIQFHITGNYVTGGLTGFTTFVKTILGTKITIVDVQPGGPHICGGYVLGWDRANDTLRIYGTGSADKAPLTELANGDACAITDLELLIEWV